MAKWKMSGFASITQITLNIQRFKLLQLQTKKIIQNATHRCATDGIKLTIRGSERVNVGEKWSFGKMYSDAYTLADV